eukprot:TRINITY_DN1589_c0_g3_i1.p1 TRINITY_DN1589_c0_g3~~TRINITY_DN1589_c0_g3_i1.p1  ORF type:complete len:253 (+),score=35.54 TRINITY_DN1589_c0_g3_i1:78-836(+)
MDHPHINLINIINISSDTEIEKIKHILKNLSSFENFENLDSLENFSNKIISEKKKTNSSFSPDWLNEEKFSSFNSLRVSNKELLYTQEEPIDVDYIKMKYHEVTNDDIDRLSEFNGLKYLNLHGCVFKDGSENNLKNLFDKEGNQELFINTISTNIPIEFYKKLDLKHLLKFIFMEYSILKGDRVMDYLEFCIGNKSDKFTSSQLKEHYDEIEDFLFEKNSLGECYFYKEDYDWKNVKNEEWDDDISYNLIY